MTLFAVTGAAVAPSPLVSISPSWFVVCLLLVITFAWTRPFAVRDFEDRKLAFNATAQIAFVLAYCMVFLALVLAVHYARPVVSQFFSAVGAIDFATRYLQPKTDATGGFPPLFALTILGWFQSVSMLREIERTMLVYVYSARYRFADIQSLGSHLSDCPYDPTPEERAKNRQVLERLNVFLSDSDTRTIDIKVIGDWRKVETLLRHIRAWQEAGKIELTLQEIELLEKVITAHERKTALALNIIRMLDHVAKGGGTADTFGQVTDIIKAARDGDRAALEAAEVKALELVKATQAIEAVEAASGAAAEPPKLRLSSAQLKQFLGQISSYFEEEYRILLHQVADLTAKAVVHSASESGNRLSALKTAGFAGIGELVTIRFDRILWVFFVAFFASMVLFLFRASMMPLTGERPTFPIQQQFMMIGTISLTIGFATIVGAFVGSTRSLAQSPRMPILSYGLAGLFAVFLFFIVHTARIAISGPPPAAAVATGATVPAGPPAAAKPAIAAQPAVRSAQTPFARQPTLQRSIPWGIIPFMVTIGICMLARLSAWPVPAAWGGRIVERSLDGLALGGVMVLAVVLVHRVAFPALEAFPALDIRRPPAIAEAWRKSWIPLNMLWLQLGTGFAIGAMVLRDIRRVAHSRIVFSTRREQGPASVRALKASPLPDAMPAT